MFDPNKLTEKQREDLYNLVNEEYFQNKNKTDLWFEIPNYHLGNLSPNDLIELGRINKLYQFINLALEENKNGRT